MMVNIKQLLLGVILLALVACGGGGSGSGKGSSSKSSSSTPALSSVSSVESSLSSSNPSNSSSSNSSNNSLRIIGYTPSWSTLESTIQYDKLTHINYAFVLPNTDGSLGAVPEHELLESIVEGAHENNVKVVVSIGGWNDGNDSAFVAFANSEEGRTRFTNAVLDLIELYELDGIDIDWEYPDPGTEANNYSLLMQQLSEALRPNDKLLTAAVVALGWYGDGVKSDVFGYVDFLNLMAYDKNNSNHSPYSYAEESITYWSDRGLPAEKLVLGVPYYARPSWNGYNIKINQNEANICRDSDGTDYWNGIPTIRQKAQLARSYGGLMTWELSQDTNTANSLLTAMWEVLTGAPMSYSGCN